MQFAVPSAFVGVHRRFQSSSLFPSLLERGRGEVQFAVIRVHPRPSAVPMRFAVIGAYTRDFFSKARPRFIGFTGPGCFVDGDLILRDEVP